jgi:hypothetical protein
MSARSIEDDSPEVPKDFPHNLITMFASHASYKISGEEDNLVQSSPVGKLVVVITLAPLFSAVMAPSLESSSKLSPEKVAKNFLEEDYYTKNKWYHNYYD